MLAPNSFFQNGNEPKNKLEWNQLVAIVSIDGMIPESPKASIVSKVSV